jgi:hypothetical protein
MGWLRDLLIRSEPPVASLGELARKALGHPDWPEGTKIQERSLAALLSKLDRLQELDWLRDRPRELDCLAQVLGRPASELRLSLGDAPVRRDRRMLRLHDLRFSRDVDLVREDLPPGFPAEVKHPVHWMPALVWLAPAGAGRSWLGAFLEARGLGHFRTEAGLASLEELPAHGALFVDLAPTSVVDPKLLDRLGAKRRPLCLAVSRPEQLHGLGAEIQIVSSPEPSEYLDELAGWVEERLSAEGHYSAERASAWLRQSVLRAGAARTLGEVLGFLGLCDEVSPRQLAQASLSQVLELFVNRRLRSAHESVPVSGEYLMGLLVEGAVRLKLQGSEDLGQARTAAAWTLLLSPEKKEEARRPGRKTPSLDLVPHALFRALLGAGLLRRSFQPLVSEQDELYQLAPHCLTSLIRSLAYDELLNAEPEVWGRALFLGRSTEAEQSLFEHLLARARRGDYGAHTTLIDGLSTEAGTQVDFVNALEAGIESLGALCLEGQTPPSELSHDLLREYSRYLLRIGDELVARVRKTEGLVPCLLALALEEAGLPPQLDPIRSPDDALLKKLTVRLLQTTGPDERVAKRLLLLSRSWQARGALPEDLPEASRAALACVLEKNPLPATVWNALGAFPLTVLEQALYLESLSAEGLHSALWQEISGRLESGQGDPASESVAGESVRAEAAGLSAASAEFWRAAPTRALASRELERHVRFDLLLPHQLEAVLRVSPLPLAEKAARFGPVEILLARLAESGPSALGEEALKILLERSANRTARCLLQRYLVQHDIQSLEAMLRHNQLTMRLADLPGAHELLLLPGPVLDGLREALARATQTTLDPQTLALVFQRSDELERSLAPLLRASRAPLGSSDKAGS